MAHIKIDELEFDHIVDFTKDYSTFAAARENGKGYLRLFLIQNATVYTRNGQADSWTALAGSERDSILARIIAARNHRIVPVYRVSSVAPQA